jgi:hypothetical protein
MFFAFGDLFPEEEFGPAAMEDSLVGVLKKLRGNEATQAQVKKCG